MKIHAQNKKARFHYEIQGETEAGISLQGWEVKSIKSGAVSIKESFVKFGGNEVFLTGMHVSPWKFAGGDFEIDELRERKLLLNKGEVNRLMAVQKGKGLAIIPLKIYSNNRGIIKVLLGTGKGKKKYDKRAKLKEKVQKREIERDLKEG